jgi:hypothetical protein
MLERAFAMFGRVMRDQWLNMGAVFGAASSLLLAMPISAQSQASPPPPSMTQSPTLAWPPASAPTRAPDQPAAPAAAPAQEPAAPAQTQAPATSPEPAQPDAATQTQAPANAAAPAAETAAPAEAAPPAKIKRAARLKPAAHAPLDIVEAIYRVSAGKDGSYSGPSAFDDTKIRQLYFSKGLIAAVAAMQAKSAGGPILNFDPITNSEGPDVQDLDIAVESEHPDRVIIAAKFKSESDSSILHYDFIKEGKVWKLDDIRGEIAGQSGQWSLREIIRNSLQRS